MAVMKCGCFGFSFCCFVSIFFYVMQGLSFPSKQLSHWRAVPSASRLPTYLKRKSYLGTEILSWNVGVSPNSSSGWSLWGGELEKLFSFGSEFYSSSDWCNMRKVFLGTTERRTPPLNLQSVPLRHNWAGRGWAFFKVLPALGNPSVYSPP